MYNRYSRNPKIVNNAEAYTDVLTSRGSKSLTQYSTFNFAALNDPRIQLLDKVVHTVQSGDTLYNISNLYYGSPEFGWIICYLNKISNETKVTVGTPLVIYIPIESILRLL